MCYMANDLHRQIPFARAEQETCLRLRAGTGVSTDTKTKGGVNKINHRKVQNTRYLDFAFSLSQNYPRGNIILPRTQVSRENKS